MGSKNPFLYPLQKHNRGEDPGPFTSYRTYKPYLRSEFRAQCVYCRLPDVLKGADAFAVEHYRPKKKFPAFVATYSNLFYACPGCNSAKGEFWPSDGQQRRELFVPNPCEHVMTAHLRFRGDRVEGRSDAGRFTIDLLRLNEKKSASFRKDYQDILDTVRSQVATNKDRLKRVKAELLRKPEDARRDQLVAYQNKLEKELQRRNALLDRLLCRNLSRVG